MAEREPNFSRMSRKKGRKDKLLNILIGVVILLILIVGVTYIAGNGKDEANDEKQTEDAPKEPIVIEDPDDEEAEDTPVEKDPDDENDLDTEESGQIVNETDQEANGQKDSSGESVTVTPSTDSNIKETLVDADWKPIGTSQTGEHVSKYDGSSDDWNEKKQAIAYATGLSEDEMIFWRIQNGGSPQKSEGIVSSKDKSEKYKVYIEWVDGEGWKPVKMDVLNTIETK
ncbi:YrrS family protein [Sporosarcina sp.]|uniref:YrrS family protein n=1 Tax=Sporosarcina sp. TaxID=49982 RepID=UPI0026353056|nr:YrrS family protein [Sporosarcina sp.]